MLNELKKDIEELKKYYDDGTMTSIKESINGTHTCEELLNLLNTLEMADLSDEEIIKQLISTINENKECADSGTYISSSDGYIPEILAEIESIILKYATKKHTKH